MYLITCALKMECFTNTTCLSLMTGINLQSVAAVLQCFAAAQCFLTQDTSTLSDADTSGSDEFDFIIIGAGSSGSVVANRLSEVKEWKILLLEAGGDPPITSDIPGLHTTLIGSKYDWQYLTFNNGVTNQGLQNGSVSWAKGKMLGGSSSMNFLFYAPGNDQDYQNWADAGNVEWSVADVRRCFKKAESLQDIEKLADSTIREYYGQDGLQIINKCNNTYRTYTEQILESWDKIGFKKVSDLNVAGFMGSGNLLTTSSNGVRQSTNKAYLKSIENRENIKIMKNAFVTKILVNENLTAYGVEVEKDGKIITINATQEVVLSAGSVSSPQILMLSGIGPKSHLESHNITCIVDSPMVGQNLQDHGLVPITVFGDTPGKLTISESFLSIVEYLVNHNGSLAQSNLVTDVAAFFSTEVNASYPNIQNHVAVVNKDTLMLRANFESIFRYNDSVLDSIAKLNENHALYFFGSILLHPHSRGNISLSSRNPKHLPLIHANYYEDIRDLKTAVEGIQMATKIINTTYFQSINGFLGRLDIDPCNDLELGSNEYWECICINLVTSIYHPVGTCHMGQNITTSVVDSRLRVHGVKNLRIIDAGIMPTLTSGNTNGPCIMIGERGSELIKEDYTKI